MRKIFLTIFISIVGFSCNDRLEELNEPRKSPKEVPADALFASGVRNMFDMMVSTNVNENVFRLYGQYWAQTTYPDESQYNMVGRQIPDNLWQNAYRDVLMDLEQARIRVEETADELTLPEAVVNNQLAIIDVCKVFTFSVLVDAFGAVPFSEALNPDILVPAYDEGADVYDGIIQMLDDAIDAMDTDESGFNENQDRVYWGSVAGWKRFANSLKLRLALTIADANETKAGTMVSEALASGVFTSNGHNATLAYLSSQPNTNPVWEDLVQSGRADYVIANTILDKLNDLEDKRLLVYADGLPFAYQVDETTGSKKDSVINEIPGDSRGMFILYSDINGEDSLVYQTAPLTIFAKDSLKDVRVFKGGVYGTANTYASNSHVGELFHQPDLEGVIMDYAEVEFLLAEAIERGFTVSGTAEEHYEKGIRASMEYWGIAEDDIVDYLANPDVAYATADGDWKQKIGTQAWIALYNRGFEGWSLWRRLDFAGFNVPPGLVADDIPLRLIFPIKEATLNPSNLDAAINLIGGSDDVQTKVFWDMN